MDAMERDDLRRRIEEITDGISLASVSQRAEEQRRVSSSMNAETPLAVLTGIRESQVRLQVLMTDLIRAQEERDNREEIRHRELCTILLSLKQGGASSPTARSVSARSVAETWSEKTTYYYGPVTISSGHHLIACVMMHLDAMLTKHPHFGKVANTDTTFMDIKEWHSLCSACINSDRDSKAGLRIPKPSEHDFKSACALVASTTQGRRPTCDISHVSQLLSDTPALMNTVEWLRISLLKCNGCLSPERSCRFRCLKYPFVTAEGDLCIDTEQKLRLGNRAVHQDVADLKANTKKEYMSLILNSNFRPMEALSKVKER